MYRRIEDIHKDKIDFEKQILIHARKKPVVTRAFQAKVWLQVETSHGWVHAAPEDYILEDVHGYLCPCEKDIFEQTYEIVDEPKEI